MAPAGLGFDLLGAASEKNLVTADGIRHLRFDWSPAHELVVDGFPVVLMAALRRGRDPGDRPAVIVDGRLECGPGTVLLDDLGGEFDIVLPPRLSRSVATEIPNACFELMPGEAHQPFQEVPDEWNARVDAFWREVEAQGGRLL